MSYSFSVMTECKLPIVHSSKSSTLVPVSRVLVSKLSKGPSLKLLPVRAYATAPNDIEHKQGKITKSSLGKLKVTELRSELQARELDTTGLKDVLIQRLYLHLHGLNDNSSSSCSTSNSSLPNGDWKDANNSAALLNPWESLVRAKMSSSNNGGQSSNNGKHSSTDKGVQLEASESLPGEGDASMANGSRRSSNTAAALLEPSDSLPTRKDANSVNGSRSSSNNTKSGTGSLSSSNVAAALLESSSAPKVHSLSNGNGRRGSSATGAGKSSGLADDASQSSMSDRAGGRTDSALDAALLVQEKTSSSSQSSAVTEEEEDDPLSPIPGARVVRLQEYALPPMPQLYRGKSWYMHENASLSAAELETILLSNPSGLILTWLGTGGGRADWRSKVKEGERHLRRPPCLALLRGKDVWMFNAGEDTQRQLDNVPFVRASKVFRIFLSSLSIEHVAGLPGLLCTVSASRLRGHEKADIPIHLYGPSGLAEYLATMFLVSNTYLEVNVLVHEYSTKAVPEYEMEPQLFNKRARIYRAILPPDQLNPQGITDGSVSGFMPTKGRARFATGRSGAGGVTSFDPRAGFLPWPPAVPGDPERADLRAEDLSWTIDIDVESRVTAVMSPGPRPAWSYVVQEAERLGKLVNERVEALKVVHGKLKNKLKEGTPVLNEDGEVVLPEMVVTPTKPGRSLVFVSSGYQLAQNRIFAEAAKGADAFVALSVVSPESSETEKKVSDGRPVHKCMDPKTLGRIAAELDVEHLILGGLEGDGSLDSKLPEKLLSLAAEACDSRVSFAHDTATLVLEKHDGRERQRKQSRK